MLDIRVSAIEIMELEGNYIHGHLVETIHLVGTIHCICNGWARDPDTP